MVTDRYSGSTLAYQGAGRGLGTDALAPVLEFATEGLHPDLSILLEVPLAVAASPPGRGPRPPRSAWTPPSTSGSPSATRSWPAGTPATGRWSTATAVPTRWPHAVAAAVESRLGWPGR